MNLYEKNIKLLTQHYPGMDINLKNAKEQEDISVQEELSKDGEKILKVTKKEHSCYLAGKRNAKEPPYEWFREQGEISENYIYIFMGIGNVGYLRELIENVKVHLNIIIYEPSIQIFKKAMEIIDLSKGMENHLIVFWIEGVGKMTLDKMDTILEKVIKLERLDELQLFVLPNYDVLFPNAKERLLKKCEDIALDQRVNYNTAMAFSKVTSINTLCNAKYLCTGYKTIQLFGAIPQDVTGIVVAAGPSLNKNIQELKNAKGKSFIIAVDTALKPLLNAGIVPDMFFIVDGKKPMDLIKKDGVEKIPMVTALNANPEILNYHRGMKIFFDESYRFAEKIIMKSGLRWGEVDTGGSVATNAFSLLYKIGLKTIILVGQDLALTGNKTHADGTFEEKMPEIDTKNNEWVEGNYEEKVPTRTDLKVFLNWYESTIRLYKGYVKDLRVINATEGGAKIEGTEVMTLKDAIEENCRKDVDIEKCLEQIPPMLNEEAQIWAQKYLAAIPDQFKKLKQEAQKLGEKYRDVDRFCRREKMDSQQYLKVLNKIKHQIQTIEQNDVYQLVTLTIPSATQILRDEEGARLSDIKEEGLEIARKGKLYTKLICEASDLLEKESEKIFADIKKEIAN